MDLGTRPAGKNKRGGATYADAEIQRYRDTFASAHLFEAEKREEKSENCKKNKHLKSLYCYPGGKRGEGSQRN